MIEVTKLNGKKYFLNALYIESVESNPDTTITLTNGKKLIVADNNEKIVEAMVGFYQRINILGLHEKQEDIDR